MMSGKSDYRMPQTVLVIEDDVSIQAIVRDNLIQLGIPEIDAYERGDEGWAAALGKSYEFIILDWKIPGISGSILLNRFRQHSYYEKIPILVVSGFINRKDFSLVEELMMTEKMEKPFRGKMLVRGLKELMEKYYWYKEQELVIKKCYQQSANEDEKIYLATLELIKKSPHPTLTTAISCRLLATKKKSIADRLMKKVMATNRSTVFLTNELGNLLFLNHKFEEAFECFTRCQKRSPENIMRLCNLGEIGLRQINTGRSEHFFQEALAIDGANEIAMAGLEISKNIDEFRIFNGDSENTSSSFAGLLNNVGIFLVRNQQFHRGMKHYENSLKFIRDGDFKAKLAFNLGLGYLRWEKPKEALVWFRNAISFSPHFKKPVSYIEKIEKYLSQHSAQNSKITTDHTDPTFDDNDLKKDLIRPGKDITKVIAVSKDCINSDENPRDRLIRSCAEVEELLNELGKLGYHEDSQISQMINLLDKFGDETFRFGVQLAIREKKPVTAHLFQTLERLRRNF